MNERPILFSGPMVRAILDGRKTQTRRVLKEQPNPIPVGLPKPGVVYTSGWFEGKPAPNYVLEKCPYGQPGHRLWVRETWASPSSYDGYRPSILTVNCGPIGYLATNDNADGYYKKWRPSIHMPRLFSRITLEIAGVRIERLDDISEDDAIAEGCWRMENGFFAGPPHKVKGTPLCCTDSKVAYRELWKSINGPGPGPNSWDANPFVWVVEFKKL